MGMLHTARSKRTATTSTTTITTKSTSSAAATSASASASTASTKRILSKMTLFAMILSNAHKNGVGKSLSLSSSSSSSAIFVSAFSSYSQHRHRLQNGNGKLSSPSAASLSSPTPSLTFNDYSYRYYSSTFTSLKASTSVEDDLDSALDDILNSSMKEAEGGTTSAGATASAIKVEAVNDLDDGDEDETPDFKLAKNLITTNPYWIKNGMRQDVIDVLSSKGITKFTEVQGSAFTPVLNGQDVIGRSRTGTGKTLAFGIPSLHRLEQLAIKKGTVDRNTGRRKRGRNVSMIVLCPTRELARQVEGELASVARPMGLFTTVFHGGVSYDPQARALRNGIDVLVGTPGRIIDHIDRGNLNLSECDIVVLDEADEMLNMGFAEDVEVILEDVGSANDEKTQCLLFSATTPSWVKEIGRNYQQNVISVDATTDQGARTATTVRHMAIQLPPGNDSKKSILEDIIAVEISKDVDDAALGLGDGEEEESEEFLNNPIAAAAAAAKKKGTNAMQQKIFGKTIVFTETKRDADELVSGAVFKSLTAQALHGDVGQKQRDATLNAFRAGSFNVLVATDVAARGIDIKDVDLVVQFSPPREVDTYVHRSGRTGRAGSKGTSVLLFTPREARDIVKIERSLGHGFKFELAGPPSTEAALVAASKTSALACKTIPEETAGYFKDSAMKLLASGEAPEDIIAKCLAAISRRAATVESRSLLTGESGFATIEMTNAKGRPVSPGDVMFTVSKLSRMSRENDELRFDSDVGKIQSNPSTGIAVFDMGVEDAKKLIEFSKDLSAGGAQFRILRELELERGRDFGRDMRGRGRGGGRGGYGRGRGGGRGGYGRGRGGAYGSYRGRGGYDSRSNNRYDNNYGGGNNYYRKNPSRSYHDNRSRGGRGGGAGGGRGYSDDGW